MTIADLILKLLSQRGDTELEITFYCRETHQTYRIDPNMIVTVYDAREDKLNLTLTEDRDNNR